MRRRRKQKINFYFYLFFIRQEQQDKSEDKENDLRPIETPRDERDTQHDAQSISLTNDIPIESETDDDSRRNSFDKEK